VYTVEKGFPSTKNKSDIYLKFPAILREKLRNGEIVFPSATKYYFKPERAFRCIEREAEDFREVDRKDFRSYAELGRKKTRGQRIDTTDPAYYGVSLFRKREIVENKMKFPNPHKKIAEGFVVQEGGPQHTNEETEHICWWLYSEADLSGFHVHQEVRR